MKRFLIIGGAIVLAAAAATPVAAGTEPSGSEPAGGTFPFTIDNCGVEVTVDAPPTRAITMNQSATEVMLALGLQDSMVGTAYLDDEILPELLDAYDAVPVLVEDDYPSNEVVLETEPDFVYAAYGSAFAPEAAGTREELADLGAASYLTFSACPDRDKTEPITIDQVFDEYRDIAAIFGVPERAEALIAEQQAEIEAAVLADSGSIDVAWWDGSLDAPFVGACCGGPGLLMEAVGVNNVFGDVEGNWATVSWEAFIDADPDVIVLVDASWDPAADKIAHLQNDPVLADLPAVVAESWVIIPFSATTPGVRSAEAIGTLAADIQALGGDATATTES